MAAAAATLRMQGGCRRGAVKDDHEFKEQVPQWLSLKEKYRRTAGAIAGRMTR
jgi:hypothetical protein